MNTERLKRKIKKLPQSPGVYIFCGKNGKALYVGKAGNLLNRILSYFRSGEIRRPIEAMMHEVADIDYVKTETVLEALVLESHLIKKLQPKYNAVGKDDKSFSYFVVTKEEYPRILIIRETALTKDKKSIIISPKKNTSLKLQIQKTYGPYVSKKQAEIALKMLRKIFPFHSQAQKTEKGCLDYQIGTCPGPYDKAITRIDYLKNIRAIGTILSGRRKSLLKRLEKEMISWAVKKEFEKAAQIRNKIFALKHIQDVALLEENLTFLSDKFQPLPRIEGYDISNIAGDYATGSMVVFNKSNPDKSQYRKFKIKTIKGSNDIAMMEEMLIRRFKNDWPLPDLILLDGGKGHLSMAERLWDRLNIAIPLAVVVKGSGKKSGGFRILLSEKFSVSQLPRELTEVLNNRRLVLQIMSEAHRFALVYHRKIRKKGLFA